MSASTLTAIALDAQTDLHATDADLDLDPTTADFEDIDVAGEAEEWMKSIFADLTGDDAVTDDQDYSDEDDSF